MTLTIPSGARRPMARAAAVGAAALVVGSLTAAPASAATSLGSTAFAASGSCAANYTWVQAAPPAGTTYSAATAGVISQWQFHATDAMQLQLKVLHFVSGTTYVVKAASDTVTAAAATTSTFSAQVPMGKDDVLGVTTKSMNCPVANVSGALVHYLASDLTAGQSASFALAPMAAIPVAASLEADADGDGYGDETQDACPLLAATHSLPCVATPPGGSGGLDTKVTKGPTETTKSKATYVFHSTDAVATFECRLKGKGVHTVQDKTYQPCTSPKKYKKLAPGHYKFFVRAIDAAGNVDATPAKVKLVVKPKKH